MVTYSKHFMAGHTCKDFYHPWTNSCVLNTCDMFFKAMRGSIKFFGIFYAAKFLANRKKWNGKYFKIFPTEFLRTISCSTLMGTSFFAFGCIYRRLFGRYFYYTVAFLPGFTAGLSILLENSKNQEFLLCYFVTLVLQFVLQKMKRNEAIKLTKYKEALLFMLLSGSLMLLLQNGDIPDSAANYWFFIPAKKRDRELSGSSEVICPHPSTCLHHALLDSAKYFTFGIGLQIVRILALYIRSTAMESPTLMRWENVLPGLFFGTFVISYHGSSCILRQLLRKNENFVALSAGVLAGSAYWICPQYTLLLTAFVAVVQQLARQCISRGVLPRNRVLLGLTFAVCSGILFHSRLVAPDITSQAVLYMLTTFSGGRSEEISENYYKIHNLAKFLSLTSRTHK